MLKHKKLLKKAWSTDTVNRENIIKELYRFSDELYPFSWIPNISNFEIKGYNHIIQYYFHLK